MSREPAQGSDGRLRAGDRFAGGRSYIVTGGARGIGAGICEALVAEGGRVIVADIDGTAGQQVADDLGASAAFVRLNVTRETDWANAVKAAVGLGRLTGLVNNAGIYLPRPLRETDAESFTLHMQVNQLGCFLGMKAVADIMAGSGGGSIVNISSSAGLKGSPGAIAYSGTKWAVRGMTKAAAIDLAANGIRVNSIHPGPVATTMQSALGDEGIAKRIARVPLARNGQVKDIVGPVLFLLSDESAYMTGAELAVDGGITL